MSDLLIFVYQPIFYLFLINFIRILRFIWDLRLVLFDSHDDVVSGKNLVFGLILSFLGVNWAPELTKTINFGYVQFLLAHLILKIVQRLALSYERRTSGQNFSKFESYLQEKGPRTTPHPSPLKGDHFMDDASPPKHLKIYNLTTTSAALIKLNTIMYLHKTFNLAEDWGITHRA